MSSKFKSEQMSALSIAVSPSRRLASGLFQYVVLENDFMETAGNRHTVPSLLIFIVQALIYLTGR